MRANNSSRGLSSPCSTNDGISLNGSPDTKLTAFSPEDVRSKGRPETSVATSLGDAGFCRRYTARPADPFLVPLNTSNSGQLSPHAASFTPIGIAGSAASDIQVRGRSEIGSLNAQANVEICGARNGPGGVYEQGLPNYGPIGRAPITQKGCPTGIFAGNFDNDRRSRAFVIENVPASLNFMSLAGFFNRREFATLKGPVLNELSSLGKVYVAFADSREAKKAIEKVRLLRPEWRIFPLTAKEYVQHSEPSLLHQTSDYEGHLLVSMYYDSRNPTFNSHTVARSLQTLATTFGDLKAFDLLPRGQDNVSEFHLEFYNTRDADNAMVTLNGTTVDDCILDITLFKPDVTEDRPFNVLPSLSPVKDGGLRYGTSYHRSSPSAPTRPFRTPYMELSPTGRSIVPSGEHVGLMDWMSRAGEKNLHSPRREISRYPDARVISQNAVDIERIRLGLDVRTTIMLRNIPNKIDQTMLKAIVDETSHGKYDFMYLRIGEKLHSLFDCKMKLTLNFIDFANNCNVGYAFINFEDPIDIIDFVKTRAGRSWNCFNSDKVAEVSYATIQGKDCLIQKFRNSSVMLEHPSFRPKIFHTGTGPLAGTEDRFPGPDNPSKMRRSIENAEHIGLFAPRVGQQYRDEQRRRRSQFDRGTTAAEGEIVYVQTIAAHPFGVNNGLRSAPCTYPTSTIWYDPTISARGPRTS
ncbi:meiosis protein MEI2 [Aspergillus fumigatus]|nr:meiosis protein MEI2 [Aspergillus fumigatus]